MFENIIDFYIIVKTNKKHKTVLSDLHIVKLKV